VPSALPPLVNIQLLQVLHSNVKSHTFEWFSGISQLVE